MTHFSSSHTSASPQGAQQKKRGCLFYGCITVIVLALGIVLATWLFFSQVVRPFFGQYASEQTVALAPSAVTPDLIATVETRVRTFAESIAAHRPTEPLVLDEADLNALLAHLPQIAPIAQYLRVSIEDDRLRGEFALPLNGLGYADKFLNLSGTFRASLEYGLLSLTAESATVNGEPLSESVVAELQRQNLAADLLRNPEVAKVLRELKAIEVSGGRVIVTPK
jgi:hypothetical protein